MSINKWTGIGRLTKDPEIKYSSDGLAIGRGTIAIDRPGQDKGADFIPLKFFGKSAEFAEKYFHKGSKIGVEGRIQSGSYKKEDGTTVYTLDVIAEKFEFCDSRQQAQEHVEEVPDMEIPEGIEEQLPFK